MIVICITACHLYQRIIKVGKYLKSWSLTIYLMVLGPLLNHVSKHHICAYFWTLSRIPPFPLAACSNARTLSEEIFSNILSKPPLVQPFSLVLPLVPGSTGYSHLATSFFQVVVESSKISLSFLFPKLNNPSSLSSCSQVLCSRPVTSFFVLLWTSSRSVCEVN